MANVWQQVLALDARYNTYRTPNSPGTRMLYIRRRSQLLRDNAKKALDPQARKWYLKVRSQLLSRRYGVVPSEGSVRSSLSKSGALSTSQVTLEGQFNDFSLKSPIVPTSEAGTSRALVGDTSLSENYSFGGIHHVFDQHVKAENASISHLKFAHDEKSRLAISSMDGRLSICDVSDDSSECKIVLKLTGHTKGVTDFAWSLSNDLIVSCSFDSTVRVWDSNSGECIRIMEDQSPVLCCTFQPLNNNLVVTGNSKGIIQVLNISTGKYVKPGGSKVSGNALCMCCDNLGRLLWVGDSKGHITSFLVDETSGRMTSRRKLLVSLGRAVTSVSCRAWVSRESRDVLLLANCCANSLCLFKVVDGDGTLVTMRRYPIKQMACQIRSSFCPLMSFRQGAVVLSGSEDGLVYLLDIEQQQQYIVNKLQGHKGAVLDVTFCHDESLLASGDSMGCVLIWKRQKTS